MKTRLLLLVVLFVAGSATVLDAQTRRIGSTREDQHPASPSSTRGEERAPATPAPPPPAEPSRPVQPTGPVHPHPTPVVPIEGWPVTVVVEAFLGSVAIPRETEPLWPVVGTEILDRLTDTKNSGYNFEDGEIVPFNDDDADLYYADSLLRVADDSDIQDLGPAKSVREYLRVRKDGWEIQRAVEVQAGHQYAVWRWNGEVVRLFVEEVLDDAVVFDWMPGLSIERTDLKGPAFGR